MNQGSSQQYQHQYDYVPAQKRLTLIQMVIQGTSSIGKAAIELGIKLSTAKLIVKKFRTTGRIYVSKKEREQQKQSNGKLEEVRQQLNAYNTIKGGISEIENGWAHHQTPCLYNSYDNLPILYAQAPVFFYYF